MVLKGEFGTTAEMLSVINPEVFLVIIPELQNRSIISVVHRFRHFGALTSSGKLLTWGYNCWGALGLGDPGKLPVESPGGHKSEYQQVHRINSLIPSVTVPSEVRFDHGLKAEGRVERYCLAVAAGFMHTVALVIDLAGDEVPPEDLEQHFETTVPREGSNNPDHS